ncbi:hypothetical protein ACFO5R_07560 [Halosolutus amylolyticus]|uniref:Uncharacterized protein n=1 Tax=Halosolutus amylolyticus TaxID=2932267 RepID=A0ABD5PMM3_9EURY|nr:hypothetical protein [Halosolutus amylolyticus]
MPDDNRFAGLSEAVGEDGETSPADGEAENETGVDDEIDEPGTGSDASAPETDATTDAETVLETGTGDDRDGDDGGSDSASDASDGDPTAFAFDETTKKTVYVRPGTLDELEDARALVDAQLRTQHDVRDLTGREFYDAAFRLAAADTDGLIDEILAARDE